MREVLHELARPRLFGTAGASHVAAAVRARLEAAGLAVEVQEFRFSTWPGRFAVPALGVLLAGVFVAAAILLGRGYATTAAATLAVAVLVLLSVPFVAGPAVDRLPFGRATGMNLVAKRPGHAARFLIVAHRDSKSQIAPLGLRILAAALIGIALAGGATAAAAGATGTALPFVATGGVASLVFLLCSAGNASPGALDNATGLAALLDLAGSEAEGDVAFLVTDAEELGLAGARAAVSGWRAMEAVINVDGLDDGGPLRLLTGRGPAATRRARPLADALTRAGRERGLAVRSHRVPAGLMVDHLPFASAGIRALTVMRGRTRALGRVHRAADSADRLTGEGARAVAAIVHAALETLRAAVPRPPAPGPSRGGGGEPDGLS
jgi:hypothetical protein